MDDLTFGRCIRIDSTYHVQTLLMAYFTIEDPVGCSHAVGCNNAAGQHRARRAGVIH